MSLWALVIFIGLMAGVNLAVQTGLVLDFRHLEVRVDFRALNLGLPQAREFIVRLNPGAES